MGWLALVAEWDEAGWWAARELSAAGLDPLDIVTDRNLIGATWNHSLQDGDAHTVVELTDGRVLDSRRIRGTLNRLIQAPWESVAGLDADDRDYGFHEISALYLSWLQSLCGPILNPPSPRGLCGAWRSGAEWVTLASESGLHAGTATSETRTGSHRWRPALSGTVAPVPGDDVIVAGGDVFSAITLDARTLEGCRRLADRAGTPLLGISFACPSCSGIPEIAGASPFPDLRLAGPELIASIAAILRSEPITHDSH